MDVISWTRSGILFQVMPGSGWAVPLGVLNRRPTWGVKWIVAGAFEKAANEIEEIRSEYARRILDGGDEQYGTLRNEAVGRMVEAIEEVGLDEETYRGIAYHVNKNEGILSKIF